MGVPGGGVANAIVGSAITVGLGLLVAAPVGVLAAFFVAFRPNTPLGLAVRFGTDVIAGVPSIVMAIFAYALIVLPQRHFSAFSGGMVLSFIMLPIIIRSTEEMLKLVPNSLREGSLALGAAEWRTSLSVILPAAGNGVLTGMMLAIARAAGEAAPMLFTAFGNPFMSASLNQPVATLPHTIYVYANLALRRLARQGLGHKPGADRAGSGAQRRGAPDRLVAGPPAGERGAMMEHEGVMTKISIRSLSVYHRAFRALADVSLEIPANRITAIIGPSGVGKSTLLRSMNRMTDLVHGCADRGPDPSR